MYRSVVCIYLTRERERERERERVSGESAIAHKSWQLSPPNTTDRQTDRQVLMKIVISSQHNWLSGCYGA